MSDFQKVLDSINAHKFQPIYFISGEEDYFIDEIANALLQNVIPPEQKDFNQHICYGSSTDLRDLNSLLMRYPFMYERQLVMLKDAQDFKPLKELAEYLEQPAKSTVFAIIHKKKSGNNKFIKALKSNKQTLFFESNKVPEYKMPDWVKHYVKSKGFQIDAQAVNMLVELLGTDVQKMANEIEKILINQSPGQAISTDVIHDKVGLSRQYNVFELQDALGSQNYAKAWKIASVMSNNMKDNPMVFVVNMIYRLFSQLKCLQLEGRKTKAQNVKTGSSIGIPPFKVDDYFKFAEKNRQQTDYILAVLMEYEKKAKGIGNYGLSESALFREMILKIINGRP